MDVGLMLPQVAASTYLHPASKVLHAVLLQHVDQETMLVTMSQQQLAELVSVSGRTVRSCIAELQECQCVEVLPDVGKVSTYRPLTGDIELLARHKPKRGMYDRQCGNYDLN